MSVWLHETYWSCRLISAMALLKYARTPAQERTAKLAIIKALTYLGKYDFSVAEFANYTRMKFAEEHDASGWI